MAEQKSRGARGVRKRAGAAGGRARRGAGEAVEEAGSTAGGAAKGAAEAADELQGGQDRRHEDADGGRQEPRTMREELGAIVRESAMEVLRPIMVNATRKAAKYAVKKAPEVAMDTVLPKLRELGSNIEEAGGAGAFARGTLSSASEGGGLSKLKQLGRGDGEQKATERVPEQESVDVAVPLERTYERFTQLDDFAELLSGGEVVEEQENERLVWTSGDESATAVVTFHRLDDRLTKVMVSYDEESQNLASKALSALQPRKRALRSDLARFKALAEMGELEREDEDGGARSSDEGESPRRRRRSSRAQEPEEDDYGEDEPYEGEVEDEPEAEGDEEPEAEEIPEAEVEDEGEFEDEPEEAPEPEPQRRPARRRPARRRAPARPRASRAKQT